jgi:pimeloyl-ACP methyl ester carboxylesterase
MNMKMIRLILILAGTLLFGSAQAQDKIGVVLMHGKQGGGSRDSSLDSLQRKLFSAGFEVRKPEMPWSFNRFIDGNWNTAMNEIKDHVQNLKQSGATKVVLIGHSLGSPAAMSYAARHADVAGIALLAPGHVPYYYSQCIPYAPIKMCAVKEGVEQALKEVASGNGDNKQGLADINQGRRNIVWMTPRDYLSYFDPNSDAEMAVTASKIPVSIPVLWVIGDKDYLIREGRQYVFDRLPNHPKNRYLEVSANHITTPSVAADEIVNWIKSVVTP